MTFRTSRRSLLRGAAAGLALPFIRQLEARGQTMAAVRRLFVFATPNGTVMNSFWPAGGGTTYGEILKPLQPLQAKLNVMRGINIASASHAPVPIDHLPDCNNMLTGHQPTGTTYSDISVSDISVDQYIANKLGTATRIPSLQLAVIGSSSVSSRGPGLPLYPERSPYAAFNRVFAQVTGTDPTVMARLRADRQSVLDSATAELKKLSCAVGAEERPKLDAHLTSIRQLERELDSVPASSCVKPTQGTAVATNTNDNAPQLMKLHMDVIAAAFACDATRVVTMWSDGRFVPHWLGINGTHHGISHNSEGVDAPEATRLGWLVQIENWFAQQFFYLADKLEKIQEGGGKTLLDNSCLLWAHEQSNGASHQRTDMPYVLAGSCGGYFKLGQRNQFSGVAHNNLLLSIAEAMGYPIAKFGDPALCTGPIAALKA